MAITEPDPTDEKYSCTACGLNASVEHQKDEALRELLSHCRTTADGPTVDGIYGHNEVYDEIANRLAKILDGEQ